jgi:hypothetical protein
MLNPKGKFVGSIFIVSMLMIGGCVTQPLNTAAVAFESNYSPKISSSRDVDAFFEMMKVNSKRVVEDKNGKYYHETQGNLAQRAFLNRTDGEEVKQVLQKGYGLLIPIYKVRDSKRWSLYSKPGPEVIPDWPATRRRWNFLTVNLKLRLLPLDASEKFDAALVRTSLRQDHPYPNFYYNGYSVIVERSGLKPDYLIDNGLVQERFRLAPISENLRNKEFLDRADVNLFYVNYVNSIVTDANYIAILPMRIYDNLKSGSVYLNSICQIIDSDRYKIALNQFQGQTGRVFSGKQIDAGLWTDYRKLVLEQEKYERSIEEFCATAFLRLGLSGAVQSDRLD